MKELPELRALRPRADGVVAQVEAQLLQTGYLVQAASEVLAACVASGRRERHANFRGKKLTHNETQRRFFRCTGLEDGDSWGLARAALDEEIGQLQPEGPGQDVKLRSHCKPFHATFLSLRADALTCSLGISQLAPPTPLPCVA